VLIVNKYEEELVCVFTSAITCSSVMRQTWKLERLLPSEELLLFVVRRESFFVSSSLSFHLLIGTSFLKIPSPEPLRFSPCARRFYERRRRSLTDLELAESPSYEERVRLNALMAPSSKVVAASVRLFPLPTFSGSKKEDIEQFLRGINVACLREKSCYEESDQEEVKLVMLTEACTGKASSFIHGLAETEKNTYDKLVASLRSKHASAETASKKVRALTKAEKLKQRSGEDIKESQGLC
jgi:hypothetical protein